MTPMVRTALTHVGTAGGAMVATAMFLATKTGDLVSVYDQINIVVADATKLIATVLPLATAAYGVYKATSRAKLVDLSHDPAFKGAVVSVSLAGEVPSAKVVSSVGDLPTAAKTA